MTTTGELLAEVTDDDAPSGILDESGKREIRRAALTAVCVPGYQVPFGSREMPVARGWGSGGLQVTLSVIGADDTVKVIDQGDDGGVNASNLRRMIAATTGCSESADTRESTVVQTRHRVPEEALGEGNLLVYQVPVPEPLRKVQKSVAECARMHAENDYATMWVGLYEDIVRNGMITRTTGYPVLVAGRYVMATTPIPRWDVPRLHRCEHINLFGAGREKRIYAVPPHTDVEPLTFDDVPFEVEYAAGAVCRLCGSDDVSSSRPGPVAVSCAATPNGAPGSVPATPTARRIANAHRCICCPTREIGPAAPRLRRVDRTRCRTKNLAPSPPTGCFGRTRSARCTAPAASTPSTAPAPTTGPRSARPPAQSSLPGMCRSMWPPARRWA